MALASRVKAEKAAEKQKILESMTEEELVQALVQARITEARLKKGCGVKGDGSVIHYSSKNTR